MASDTNPSRAHLCDVCEREEPLIIVQVWDAGPFRVCSTPCLRKLETAALRMARSGEVRS